MSTYASWERRDVFVAELLLDAHNPRIPNSESLSNERSIVAQLIEHEDVYSLAKGIASQGFYPSELLICIEDGDDLIVIEGNRRLASLKLLATPELAPNEKEIARFRKLTKLAGETLTREMEVVIAPSRSDTVPLVMAKHTREGVKSWEPLQQANYVKTLLDSGIKLDQLPSLTGIPKGEILKNLRTNSLYEMATRLPLDRKTRDIVLDPRKFSASTLERVSGSPDMRNFLGISFDQQGGVIGHVAASEFAKIYGQIVRDIATKVVDTRELNKAKGVLRYIRKLQPKAPDRTKAGSFTSESFLAGNIQALSAPTETAEAPKRRGPNRSTALISRSFKCHLNMPRINDVLRELQHLKVGEFENAVSVLLRIFIELSISNYLDSTGKMEALIQKIDKKNQKPKDWTPSLRQMLDYVLTNDGSIKIPRQALKALNKAVSDDDYPLSLDGMDQFVHNPYVSPSERQLRQFWSAFEKLMGHLMEDHTPSSPAASK